MHLAPVCELPKANPLPKGRSLEVKRHTSDAQCPVRTWKRHAELWRCVKAVLQCLTCFKFSMELQQWPGGPLKHIIHTQNPFLSVTGVVFVSVTFVARCREDGAPLATGDLASAGLCGISWIFASHCMPFWHFWPMLILIHFGQHT